MHYRAVVAASFAFVAVLATAPNWRVAEASSRHGEAIAAHDATITIGAGHALGSAHGSVQSHPILTIPLPGAIQEHRANRGLETAPSSSTVPAAKPSHDPFPDFNVPLRRHRMAIPDSVIPAFGDLSF